MMYQRAVRDRGIWTVGRSSVVFLYTVFSGRPSNISGHLQCSFIVVGLPIFHQLTLKHTEVKISHKLWLLPQTSWSKSTKEQPHPVLRIWCDFPFPFVHSLRIEGICWIKLATLSLGNLSQFNEVFKLLWSLSSILLGGHKTSVYACLFSVVYGSYINNW